MISKIVTSITKLHVNRPLVGILLLSLFLNSLGIWYGLPYPTPPAWIPDGDKEPIWVFDSMAPVGPLAAGKDGFSWGGWSHQETTYPLAHYMLLGILYAPYVGYLFLSGGFEADPSPGYPYGLSDPTTALTVLTLIARVVAILMGTGIVLTTYLIAKEVFDRRAALLSALIVALCNTLIFYAHMTNLDVPYIFWSMLALWAYVRLVKQGHLRYCVLLGVFAAVAIATKDQAYGLFLLLPLPVLWVHYRHYGKGPLNVKEFIRLVFHKNVVLAMLSFLMAFTLANNLLFNFPRFVLHMKTAIGYQDQDRHLNPAFVVDHFRLFGLTLDYLRRSMGLPFLLVSIAGLIYCIFRFPKRTWPLLVPLVSYYFLFLVAGLFYVHARHVIPIAIILSLFGGKVLADLISSKRMPSWASHTLLTLVFGYSMLYGLSADLTLLNDSRHIAGLWLERNVAKGARIEVYSRPIFLPRFLYDYQVYQTEFNGDYFSDLKRRRPDYVIVTEQQYRTNADQSEAVRFLEARQENPNLQALLSEQLGYQLQFNFKFKLHDWFYPDMFYGQNPRILIFKRVSDS